MNTSCQQRLYAIRVSEAFQAFCPAQTSVQADRKVARNPLLHIASTVMANSKNKKKLFSPEMGLQKSKQISGCNNKKKKKIMES